MIFTTVSQPASMGVTGPSVVLTPMQRLYDEMADACWERLKNIESQHFYSTEMLHQYHSPHMNLGRQSGKTSWAAIRSCETDVYIGYNSGTCNNFRSLWQQFNSSGGNPPTAVVAHQLLTRGFAMLIATVPQSIAPQLNVPRRVFVDEAGYLTQADRDKIIAEWFKVSSWANHPVQFIFLG